MKTLPPAILAEARVWALHPARWSATKIAEKLAARGYEVKPNTIGRWAWRVRERAYGKVPGDVGSPGAVTVTLAFASAEAAIQFLSRANAAQDGHQ